MRVAARVTIRGCVSELVLGGLWFDWDLGELVEVFGFYWRSERA